MTLKTSSTALERRERIFWELSRRRPRNNWLYYEARKGTGFDSSETGRKSLSKEIRK